MIPEKKDFPIIAELEDAAGRCEGLDLDWLADLLRQAIEEIYRAHYNAWETAMVENI